MQRRVGFEKKLKYGILYLANFPLLLSFHESNIVIKISLLAYFKQSKERKDLTHKNFELRIP